MRSSVSDVNALVHCFFRLNFHLLFLFLYIHLIPLFFVYFFFVLPIVARFPGNYREKIVIGKAIFTVLFKSNSVTSAYESMDHEWIGIFKQVYSFLRIFLLKCEKKKQTQ